MNYDFLYISMTSNYLLLKSSCLVIDVSPLPAVIHVNVDLDMLRYVAF
jgi:hypothetical protein